MSSELLYLIPLIFLIAFLYSSVGHGGASGYLALMGMIGISAGIMRPSALILNLFVAGISFQQYYKAGYFRKNIFIPLGMSSIPMAFIGARIDIDAFWYKRILAACLLLASLRILGLFAKKENKSLHTMPVWAGIVLGGSLGLISGMIGIGGGILLSPALLLFRWSDVKETASISALFILVNSLAGLVGLFSKGVEMTPSLLWWIFPAILGGIAGSHWGSKQKNMQVLKQMLGAVLILASIKLCFE